MKLKSLFGASILHQLHAGRGTVELKNRALGFGESSVKDYWILNPNQRGWLRRMVGRDSVEP